MESHQHLRRHLSHLHAAYAPAHPHTATSPTYTTSGPQPPTPDTGTTRGPLTPTPDRPAGHES